MLQHLPREQNSCLRAVPCDEASYERCIRQYQIEGVQEPDEANCIKLARAVSLFDFKFNIVKRVPAVTIIILYLFIIA